MDKNEKMGESDTGITVLFEPPRVTGSKWPSDRPDGMDLTPVAQDFINRIYDLLDTAETKVSGYCCLDEAVPNHSVEVVTLEITDLVTVEIVMRVQRP